MIFPLSDHTKLISVTYEHIPVVPDSLEPHLWGYRPRISLIHLQKALQQHKSKYPVLEKFLKEVSRLVSIWQSLFHRLHHFVLSLSISAFVFDKEPTLRATQYLPDIVKLQQRFFHAFHHRLDRQDARGTTIGQFIQGRKSSKRKITYNCMKAGYSSFFGSNVNVWQLLPAEDLRMEYQHMVESIQKAWSLVGDKLKEHGTLICTC